MRSTIPFIVLLFTLATAQNSTISLNLTAPNATNFSYPYLYPLYSGIVSDNFSLIHEDEGLYLVQVTIGTPKNGSNGLYQQFNVSIDTGSQVEYTWVANASCKSCAIQNRYNSYLSSTFSNDDNSARQARGSQLVSGPLGTDIINILNTSNATQPPVNTSLEMIFATQEENFPYPAIIDGELGLSNDENSQNIFEASAASGQINSTLFGLILVPKGQNSNFTSYLIYNNIAPIYMQYATWVPLQSKSDWIVTANTFQFNGKPFNQLIHVALLSSGSQYLEIDYLLFDALTSYYLGQVCYVLQGSDYQCPCRPTPNQARSLPTISITFNGLKVDVPYQNYISNYYIQESGYCSLAIRAVNTETNDYMVFGDPVLRSMVTIFDKDNQQVGLISYISKYAGEYILTALALIVIILN